MGDAVFELLVRDRLLSLGNAPVNELHRHTVEFVRASSQSNAVGYIEDLLTEEETAVYKRGRNANGNVPKSSSPGEYRRATGLEALFGFLYIKNEMERIRTLFDTIWDRECVHDEDKKPNS